MAANQTHLLVLSAVSIGEPINGYQIRRELLSWRVDEWANVNPGSIYNSLSTLTRNGWLTRHDLVDNGREVAVYETNPAGRQVLREWQLEALTTVDIHDRVAFQVSFSTMHLLTHDEVLSALTERRRRLREEVDALRAGPETTDGVVEQAPPHARRAWLLWGALAQAELAWLDETVELIRDHRLPLGADEDWGWQPPPDDPGWQMVRDAERYREMLGRS